MDGRDTLHDSKTTDGKKSDRVDTTRMEKNLARLINYQEITRSIKICLVSNGAV